MIHDNWDRCNYIIENGLAREGPKEFKGDMNSYAVIPMGNDNFMIAAGSRGSSTTYDVFQINLNVRQMHELENAFFRQFWFFFHRRASGVR